MRFRGVLRYAVLLALSEALARPDDAVHEWSEDLAEGDRASAAADFTGAARSFEKALKAAKAKGPDGQMGVAMASNSLATAYVTLGRYTEAESLYRTTIAIWRKALGAAHPHVATALNNLGVLCGRTGRYHEAERLYTRALSIHETTLGALHPLVANDLNNLALVYSYEKKYSAAQKLFQRAIDISSATSPPNKDLPEFLNNLGALYLILERPQEAQRLFERALALQESGGMARDDPRIAVTLRYMADAATHRRDHEGARALYLRALPEIKEHFGPLHPQTAATLFGIALTYERQKRYAEAEPYYKALVEIEGAATLRASNSAIYLRGYARILRRTGRSKEAAEIEKRAEERRRQAKREYNTDATIDVQQLAVH